MKTRLFWLIPLLFELLWDVEFSKDVAKVTKVATGKVVGHFPRSQGLYIGKMELRMFKGRLENAPIGDCR